MGVRRRLLRELLASLKYIRNLTQEQIRASLWRGEATLQDLEFEPTQLQKLFFDVCPCGLELLEVRVQELTVRIPWRRIMSQSIVLHASNVEVRAAVHCEDEAEWRQVVARLQRNFLRTQLERVENSPFSILSGPSGAWEQMRQRMSDGMQAQADRVALTVLSCHPRHFPHHGPLPQQEEGPRSMTEVLHVVGEDILLSPCDTGRAPTDKLRAMATYNEPQRLLQLTKSLKCRAFRVSPGQGCCSGCPTAVPEFMENAVLLTCHICQKVPSDGSRVCPFIVDNELFWEFDGESLEICCCECQARAFFGMAMDIGRLEGWRLDETLLEEPGVEGKAPAAEPAAAPTAAAPAPGGGARWPSSAVGAAAAPRDEASLADEPRAVTPLEGLGDSTGGRASAAQAAAPTSPTNPPTASRAENDGEREAINVPSAEPAATRAALAAGQVGPEADPDDAELPLPMPQRLGGGGEEELDDMRSCGGEEGQQTQEPEDDEEASPAEEAVCAEEQQAALDLDVQSLIDCSSVTRTLARGSSTGADSSSNWKQQHRSEKRFADMLGFGRQVTETSSATTGPPQELMAEPLVNTTTVARVFAKGAEQRRSGAAQHMEKPGSSSFASGLWKKLGYQVRSQHKATLGSSGRLALPPSGTATLTLPNSAELDVLSRSISVASAPGRLPSTERPLPGVAAIECSEDPMTPQSSSQVDLQLPSGGLAIAAPMPPPSSAPILDSTAKADEAVDCEDEDEEDDDEDRFYDADDYFSIASTEDGQGAEEPDAQHSNWLKPMLKWLGNAKALPPNSGEWPDRREKIATLKLAVTRLLVRITMVDLSGLQGDQRSEMTAAVSMKGGHWQSQVRLGLPSAHLECLQRLARPMEDRGVVGTVAQVVPRQLPAVGGWCLAVVRHSAQSMAWPEVKLTCSGDATGTTSPSEENKEVVLLRCCEAERPLGAEPTVAFNWQPRDSPPQVASASEWIMHTWPLEVRFHRATFTADTMSWMAVKRCWDRCKPFMASKHPPSSMTPPQAPPNSGRVFPVECMSVELKNCEVSEPFREHVMLAERRWPLHVTIPHMKVRSHSEIWDFGQLLARWAPRGVGPGPGAAPSTAQRATEEPRRSEDGLMALPWSAAAGAGGIAASDKEPLRDDVTIPKELFDHFVRRTADATQQRAQVMAAREELQKVYITLAANHAKAQGAASSSSSGVLHSGSAGGGGGGGLGSALLAGAFASGLGGALGSFGASSSGASSAGAAAMAPDAEHKTASSEQAVGASLCSSAGTATSSAPALEPPNAELERLRKRCAQLESSLHSQGLTRRRLEAELENYKAVARDELRQILGATTVHAGGGVSASAMATPVVTAAALAAQSAPPATASSSPEQGPAPNPTAGPSGASGS